MLFNSYLFIYLFLPITLIGFYLLRNQGIYPKLWLIAASLVFYSAWYQAYLFLLVGSILANYFIALLINRSQLYRKGILFLGITANLALLGYYKYSNFFLSGLYWLIGDEFSPLQILLPLAISFFTFQQIAYLMDSYKGRQSESSLINYALFVSFFPQLIAGPIVHHKEMMPQFKELTNAVNWQQVFKGMLLFLIGLAKKVIIADYLAGVVSPAYADASNLQFLGAWQASLAYTFQLYFDFSGYADMAVGLGLLFGIVLPFNFNSPYQSQSIRDFWRRWHMTLSRWLKDYVYFPLGGSRASQSRIYFNVLAVALISGLWHGAGLTFVIWGACHGIALMLCRFCQTVNIKLPKTLAWLITFLFVHLAWVLFRAESIHQATDIYSALFLGKGIETNIGSWFTNNLLTTFVIGLCFIITLTFNNSQTQLGIGCKTRYQLTHPIYALSAILLFIACFFAMAYVPYSEFIYFNF